ncbi:MAG: amidohydrolase family protein [Clostridia bacterium]|nr:amidohydrolase family protein [Clostridia bacterium]
MIEMNQYYVVCGAFFDGIHQELRRNIKVLTRGNRIAEVGAHVGCPADAQVVDLSHLTVTPGLIDAHVHFDFLASQTGGPGAKFLDSNERKTLIMLYNARQSLRRGFTTVRHAGGKISTFGAVDVKHVIDANLFEASRMVIIAHAVSTPGSHTDASTYFRSNPAIAEVVQGLYPNIGSGADFARAAARREIKYGADVVKLMATGGFASPNDGPEDMQMEEDEIRAVLDVAKHMGKPTTAHVYSAEMVSLLVSLGITGVEHASMIDRETADLMLEKGVYVVPTFVPYEEIIHKDEAMLARKTPEFRNKLLQYAQRLRQGRELLVDLILNSELLVGYGTDIVSLYPNYDCWREFKAWRDSGIPALRTLVAATSANAKILRRPELGSLVPGQIADLSGWGRDILEDHEALSECSFVMKDGRIVDLESDRE